MHFDRHIYNNWIKSQFKIIEALARRESPERIAFSARELIQNTYGSEIPQGAELGISVNDVCNLTCGHCYYASTHDTALIQREGLLTKDEWIGAVSSALKLGLRHVNIVGKEPLLSPEKTFSILSHLKNEKEKQTDIRYELITNGTLVNKHIDRLREFSDFYFFSISFDGYQDDHDRVRGNGTYKKAKEGLEAVANAGIQNIAIINTAMPHNVDSLDTMLCDLADSGAQYATIGLCFPTAYNKKNLIADIDVYDTVVEKVKRAPQGLDITIGILGDEHASLLAQLYERGDIKEESLAVTSDLAPTLCMPISENPRIAIQLNVLPTMFFGGFRIDCTGAALDYCSDLRTPQSRIGFGNVRTQSMEELREIARNKLWVPYTEKYYKRLAQAFHGDTVCPVGSWYETKP